MKIRFLVLCMFAIGAASCSKEPAPKPETKATSQAQKGGHAPADVKPGSHEDWCEEHQVPESLCTRCNPALIPAFQATGDWCPEHGLPESQCRICHPDLRIERAAPEGG